MGNMCCCVQVEERTVGLTKRFGKFDRTLQPGFHFIPWICGYQLAGKLSLQWQNLLVKCRTKTKFCDMAACQSQQTIRLPLRHLFTRTISRIHLYTYKMGNMCCCVQVEERTIGLTKRFGKFDRTLQPEFHFIPWICGYHLAGKLSLQWQNLLVKCRTKTKFCDMAACQSQQTIRLPLRHLFTWTISRIHLYTYKMGNMCCCVQVEERTVGLTKRFGKFDRTLQPGFHFIPWICGYQLAGKLSLQWQNLLVKCRTKTKFCDMAACQSQQIVRLPLRNRFTRTISRIHLYTYKMGNMCCCVQVEERTVGLTKRFGKFDRTLQPGFHFIPWICGYQLAGKLSLQWKNLLVKCRTKTKDDDFVNVVAKVQYRVHQDKAHDAFYMHSYPRGQIQGYVLEVIGAMVAVRNMDEVSE